ncbi:MAG: 3'-5' exonuclease domain-containing protein 2 [Bacteroidales bacterium]|nr:3'-5' exonuclease domain-containing protein 2 [Bacteroidales bacterium]
MYKISIGPEEIEKLPLTTFTGKIIVIDTEGPELTKAIAYLKRQKYIGFDTETKPTFSPEQKRTGVALLQLSGPEKAYLFRIKKIGMQPKIREILADEKIVKIGAAVADDVRGLEKYHNFTAKSFIDLQKIGWEYGIRDKSVKKMAAIILGIKISKKEQLSNWEAETLSEGQQKYAAMDAWVCREMYIKLLKSEKNPLTKEEQMPPTQLKQMLEKKAKKAKITEEEKKRQETKKRRMALKRKLYRKRRAARKKAEKSAAIINNGQNNTEERKG